jgi:methionine synthase II (cobalamin-independent)
MFATLIGSLTAAGLGPAELAELGLEPVSDGNGARVVASAEDGASIVAEWKAAAAVVSVAVKASLLGPLSAARRHGGASLALAEAVGAVASALAAAGCPLIEIEETEAHRIGADPAERRLFRAAHRRLAEGLESTHLSLSIVGGSAWEAGPETILDAPYASLAVDLIAGPDNWRVVAQAPGDRGIVAGALRAATAGDDGPEVLLWAAKYAASTGGRGLARVGLGTAGGLAGLTWAEALEKLMRLGHAARLAGLPPGEELASSVDPRSISARSAAVGRRTIRR